MGEHGKNFYDNLGKREKRAVDNILRIKQKNRGFSLLTGKDALNQQAMEYLAQKQAFQDVLLNESFQLVDTVELDHSGKIAFMTLHGTFMILGKLNGRYRSVYSSRIHSPELDYKGQYGRLLNNAEINIEPSIKLQNGKTVKHSGLVGLAVTEEDNEDEQRSFSQISRTVTQTCMNLCGNPDEIRIHKRFNVDDYVIDK